MPSSILNAAFMLALALIAMNSETASAQAASAVPNREPLMTTPMTGLPLGQVRPAGWLLTQLQLQKRGLTGHAEQVIPQLGPDSAWLGGTGPHAENWEKGPYYVKGLVALAYTLDDAELKTKAQKWIDWSINSQRPDGSFGPSNNDDWWPRMVMTYALRQYAEATGDPRVVPMLDKYIRYMAATLPKRHLKEWGKARAGDMIDTAFWVYNRTGDAEMLKAADLMHTQAYDWTDIFTNNRFMEFGDDFQPKHGVNIAQALKMPAVWYQKSHKQADRDAWAIGMKHLLAQTTLPLDVTTGTEFLAGRSAIQGVETCTVVEQMLSAETTLAILGDASIGDSLERVAYNAMPGAMTKDLKLYQYFTPTNHVIAIRGGQGFNQDYDDALMPGPVSGFPCCCYNLHMGWPMLVQHAWMATSDGGLAAVVYGPTEVKTKLPSGVQVSVGEKTDYPFGEGDEIQFTISVDHPAKFPLKFRIPHWTDVAGLTVNGQPEPAPVAGRFASIDRQWTNGDVVKLTLPMFVSTIPGVNNSVSLARGPLVYSLKMEENKKVVKPDADGFVKLELTSPTPWNYALAIDTAAPYGQVKVKTLPMPEGSPFEPDQCPVSLRVPARRIPAWQLAWNGRCAQDPPVSPVASDEKEETITLVPFGAQTLRLTTFPVLGHDVPQPPRALRFNFDDTDMPGWVAYGGGWYVAGDRLHAASNAGSGSYGLAGVKNVATASDVSDFICQTDVTPAADGDAGLIFRVTNPAIGPNAFNGYYVGVNAASGRLILGKCTADNNWTELANEKVSAKPGVPMKLDIAAHGPEITVSVGEQSEVKIAVSDSSFSHGLIGVRQYTTKPQGTVASFGPIRLDVMK